MGYISDVSLTFYYHIYLPHKNALYLARRYCVRVYSNVYNTYMENKFTIQQAVELTHLSVEETIIQTVPYAGFPTAINALNILKELP